MITPQHRSKLYSAFAWAIFTLGATQLALVLGGPVVFQVITFCCGVLFSFFLFKVNRGQGSLKVFAKTYLFTTTILFVANALFVYLVFLKLNLSDSIFLNFYLLLFIVPLLVSIPFLHNSSNVSQ